MIGSNNMGMIFHITRQEDWRRALEAGSYRADSLERQGFIHCSTQMQVLRVANALFRGQRGMVLLCIDEQRVQPAILYEAPLEQPESPERFPHIYGPLNIDAVVAVVPFEPRDDGSFELPPQAAKFSDGGGPPVDPGDPVEG
ncbi:MAG: hypothetical protein KatS3mg057_2923 [Herpetosiphonaceae bacterium]|nr:MAG: hypothetical protein KatS3mg057_2923 [Herpetosiphonaceae bacterium]